MYVVSLGINLTVFCTEVMAMNGVINLYFLTLFTETLDTTITFL